MSRMAMTSELTLLEDGPIVIVDDNPGDVLLIATTLRSSSLTNPWKSFDNGPAFLAALADVRVGREPMPALVLLDINMPHMSGLEVLRRVRADPCFVELPAFCMFTSSTDPRDRATAEELGASGFVVKPSDPAGYVAFFNGLAAARNN